MIVYLHAFTQPYGEEPVLTQAYYRVDTDIKPNARDIEEYFRKLANEYVSKHEKELDPGVVGDFNWGDFVAEIPTQFLEENKVFEVSSSEPIDVQLFVEHDEHILDDYSW